MEYRKFARLTAGNEFEYAQDEIHTPTMVVRHPRDEHYLYYGYLRVVFTECPEPEEGYYYTDKLINDNGVPTVIWEKHKEPEDSQE